MLPLAVTATPPISLVGGILSLLSAGGINGDLRLHSKLKPASKTSTHLARIAIMTHKAICSFLARLLVSLVLPVAIVGGPIILLIFVAGRFSM
jgi:hypothetical protein